MKLKKIIIFYPSFERGGVEIILVNFISFLLKKKIKVTLISSNFNNKKFLNNKLFNYIKFYSIQNFMHNRIIKAYNASKELIRELKKSKKKETIVFSLQSSSISILISKLFGYKVVVRNAEDPIYSTYFADSKPLSLMVIALKIITYNFANGIITNSIGSKKSMNKLLLTKKKVVSIYNPYLKHDFKIKKIKKKNIILSVGRLTKQKDFKTLIYAFSLIHKKIDSYKLLIIGDGEKRNSLNKLIINLGLSKKIKILGWINNTSRYYITSKLFVLSSIYEGLGNVLIDATNYKLPVITSNCKSGPSEIIDNGKGGYLFPIKNSYKLSRIILEALNNKSITMKKTNFAKKRVNRFYINKNCSLYLNYIKKIFYE